MTQLELRARSFLEQVVSTKEPSETEYLMLSCVALMLCCVDPLLSIRLALNKKFSVLLFRLMEQ
jgi:hypothetical protein